MGHPLSPDSLCSNAYIGVLLLWPDPHWITWANIREWKILILIFTDNTIPLLHIFVTCVWKPHLMDYIHKELSAHIDQHIHQYRYICHNVSICQSVYWSGSTFYTFWSWLLSTIAWKQSFLYTIMSGSLFQMFWLSKVKGPSRSEILLEHVLFCTQHSTCWILLPQISGVRRHRLAPLIQPPVVPCAFFIISLQLLHFVSLTFTVAKFGIKAAAHVSWNSIKKTTTTARTFYLHSNGIWK